MIRAARPDDFDKVLPLFIETFMQSPMAGRMEFDRLHVLRTFTLAVQFPNFFCEVVEDDGEVVGMMGGVITQSVWGGQIASDLFLNSKKDTHKLIRRFREWAKANGAAGVNLSNISGERRLDTLIERLGIPRVGAKFLEIF